MGLGVVEGTSVKLREREERRGEKGTTSESDRLIGERKRDDGEHEGRKRGIDSSGKQRDDLNRDVRVRIARCTAREGYTA